MATYDAIVVGGGPAGSTCAYRLASAGASVLLLDRARFPRDKACGGAVTARTLRELPVGDAAGLVDPLSGDGMYEAALSARLAAEHALRILAGERDCFSGYAQELAASLAPLMRISWGAKYAFDRLPLLSFTVARTPQFWNFVTLMMQGDFGP